MNAVAIHIELPSPKIEISVRGIVDTQGASPVMRRTYGNEILVKFTRSSQTHTRSYQR